MSPRESPDPLSRYRSKRNFSRTPEPGVSDGETSADTPRFFVQKHDASSLHFDLRLEASGVLKSWAVPKGPSLKKGLRRLAVETEDHPLDYGDFEGTIPKGEYGGGTVMLWDFGVYELTETEGADHDAAFEDAYRAGKLTLALHGKRLSGGFTLIRTGKDGGERSQWLLIKRGDRHAGGADPVSGHGTSRKSGRTMREIAEGRERASGNPPAARPEALAPMLAVPVNALPTGADWLFEPKYDGIRIVAYGAHDGCRLMTRNGIDRSGDYPEVVNVLRTLATERGRPVVLDGEVVASVNGRPGRFGELRAKPRPPAMLMAFDLLLEGDDVLMSKPLSTRREQLKALLGDREPDAVRLGEQTNDGTAMLRRAERESWEGVMAKRSDSRYRPGNRVTEWRKLKLEAQQEFVVGGWTEPSGSRNHFGALLLGVYRGDVLTFVGHVGTGFSRDDLKRLHGKLGRLRRKTPPFVETPATNTPATWVTPNTVAEVRFNGWTPDGRLRHPVFMGLREDKNAHEVAREPTAGVDPEPLERAARAVPRTQGKAEATGGTEVLSRRQRTALLRALDRLENDGGDDDLNLPENTALKVGNLGKVFFSASGFTKGDLMRYYVRASHWILPTMRDRPLVLKRYPNGIDEKPFYQQKAPEHLVDIVRTEKVETDDGSELRMVGDDLGTLLALVQLGAIAVNPWHARIGSLKTPDYAVVDLDPGPDADFRRIVEVCRWVREEMQTLGLHGPVKTSGSRGLHVYLPLPAGTPDEAARLVAQVVATTVANRHPREATVERSVKARPASAVYIDYLQNVTGKTVAGAYSVRARPGATVSTPLDWSELTDDLDPTAFTIETVPDRVEQRGDLWAEAMKVPNDLRALVS